MLYLQIENYNSLKANCFEKKLTKISMYPDPSTYYKIVLKSRFLSECKFH